MSFRCPSLPCGALIRFVDDEVFDTCLTVGVDDVVSLLKDGGGVKHLLDLGHDEAQGYANVLDAVRYFLSRVAPLI